MSTPVNTSPRKPSRTSLKILCAVCKKQVTTPLFLPGSKLREQWSSLEDGEQTNIGDEDLGDDDVEMLSPEELRVLWWDDSSDDEEEEEGGEVTEESEDDDAEEKGEGNDKEEKEEADNDDEVKGHGGNEYFSSAEEMEWEAFPDLKGIYEEEERKVEVMVHDQYGVVFVEGKNEWLKERIEDQKNIHEDDDNELVLRYLRGETQSVYETSPDKERPVSAAASPRAEARNADGVLVQEGPIQALSIGDVDVEHASAAGDLPV